MYNSHSYIVYIWMSQLRPATAGKLAEDPQRPVPSWELVKKPPKRYWSSCSAVTSVLLFGGEVKSSTRNNLRPAMFCLDSWHLVAPWPLFCTRCCLDRLCSTRSGRSNASTGSFSMGPSQHQPPLKSTRWGWNLKKKYNWCRMSSINNHQLLVP